MDDDFGDLYADLDDQVNASVNAEADGSKGGAVSNNADSDSDDGDDELMHSRIGGDGPTSVPLARDFGDSEREGEDNGSDSEDDIKIVLNEEDCRKLLRPCSAGGSRGSGGDEGEDGGGHVVDCVGSLQSPPADAMAEGVELGSAGKCGGYVPQYSQFKYVRSHSAESPADVKAIGSQSVGYFSLTSGSHDWDLNEPMVPCSVVAPAIIHNGSDFYLPRNRTIFDISIETFEKKPWRNDGADINDYFNFGLNEESWKQYCEHLESFRKEAALARILSNQASESGFPSRAVSAKAMIGNVGGSLISGNEKLRGRAIQVEGGIVERRPSIDIRRARNQDSDVVIQIKMESSLEEASSPCNGDSKHIKSFDQKLGNRNCEGTCDANVACNVQSSDQDDHKIEESNNHSEQECQKLMCNVFNEASKELKGQVESKKDDEGCSLRADVSLLVTGSLSGDNVCNLSPSYLDRDCDSSKGGVSLEKSHSPARSLGERARFRDSVKFDMCVSSNSRSYESISEPDSWHSSSDHKLIQYEQNLCRKNAQRVTGVKIPGKEIDFSSIHGYKKGMKDTDIVKKAKCCHKSDYRVNLSSATKREMLFSHRTKRFVQKHDASNSITQSLKRKCNPDQHTRRNYNKRGHSLEQRANSCGDCTIEMQGCSQKRDKSDQERRVSLCRDHYNSLSKKTPLYLQEDWYLWHKMKKNDGNHIGLQVEYDDAMEHKHQERLTHHRHKADVLHSGRTGDIIREKFHRCISRNAAGPVNIEKWENPSSFDLDNSRYYADCRPLAFQADEEHHIVKRRAYDVFPLRKHFCNSTRKRERHLDHWKFCILEDTQSKKDTNKNFVSSRNYHASLSSSRSDMDAVNDDCFAEQWDQYPDEGRRFNGQHESANWHARESGSKRHKQEDAFLLETSFFSGSSLVHANHSDSYNLGKNYNFSDYYLENSRSSVIGEESPGFRVREQGDAWRCGKADNRQSGGWEEKLSRRHDKVESKRRRPDTRDESKANSSHTGVLHSHKEFPCRSVKEHDRACLAKSNVKRGKAHVYSAKLTSSKRPEEHPILQDPHVSEPEEGELIEEPGDKDILYVTKVLNSKKTVKNSSVKVRKLSLKDHKEINPNDVANTMKVVESCENGRILETLAKMERRRERFREPIAPKKEPEMSQPFPSNTEAEADENMRQRPARKRRWGGN